MSVNRFKNGVLQKIAGAVGDAVPLINNFLTNQPGKGAADANTVYQLKNEIDSVNYSLENILSYSTNEEIIGKWIDGKILYKSTVVITDTSTTHSSNTQYLHGISDISQIVRCYGALINNSTKECIPINSYESSSYYLMVKPYVDNITYRNVGFTGTLYVTIEYTK